MVISTFPSPDLPGGGSQERGALLLTANPVLSLQLEVPWAAGINPQNGAGLLNPLVLPTFAFLPRACFRSMLCLPCTKLSIIHVMCTLPR